MLIYLYINFSQLCFGFNVRSKCHLLGTLCSFICSRKQGQTNLAKTQLAGWCNTVKFEEHSCTINHFCQTTYWAVCVPECLRMCTNQCQYFCVLYTCGCLCVCTCHWCTYEVDASSVVHSYSAARRQFSSLPLCCCRYLLWLIAAIMLKFLGLER